jgi:hypothetical protein
MADVKYCVNSLPGSTHKPEGLCDDCGKYPATKRLQGETDSFGAEFADLCDDCFQKERERWRDSSGICDWCKEQVPRRLWTRDYDEGMHGSTYRVCRSCYDKQQKALEEEMEANNWY